jgi:acetyl-CoA acetyltransferase
MTKAKSAIVGLGISEMGKVYGRSGNELALEAISRALDDAGLQKDEVDGLLTQAGLSNCIGLPLQNIGGFKNLRLVNHMNAMGATPAAMVQYGSWAIENGVADVVVGVFADTPMQAPGQGAGASMAANRLRGPGPVGFQSLDMYYSPMNPNASYAMAARRHMHTYGTTSEQFGAIAVAERAWAGMNPTAAFRSPITIEDHQNSRWIAEPFHLLDCCMVSNGAVAIIVTSVERAKSLKSKPAYVLSMAQGYPGNSRRAGELHDLETGAAIAARTLYGQAGLSAKDIDVCELYDCYTYTVMVTLEDYGFCGKGEGGPFVEDGKLGPGGSLPTNTGGGELSNFYMWGMTPMAEAVQQTRGSAGERQVEKHDLVLLTGNGGILDYHASLILSPHDA